MNTQLMINPNININLGSSLVNAFSKNNNVDDTRSFLFQVLNILLLTIEKDSIQNNEILLFEIHFQSLKSMIYAMIALNSLKYFGEDNTNYNNQIIGTLRISSAFIDSLKDLNNERIETVLLFIKKSIQLTTNYYIKTTDLEQQLIPEIFKKLFYLGQENSFIKIFLIQLILDQQIQFSQFLYHPHVFGTLIEIFESKNQSIKLLICVVKILISKQDKIFIIKNLFQFVKSLQMIFIIDETYKDDKIILMMQKFDFVKRIFGKLDQGMCNFSFYSQNNERNLNHIFWCFLINLLTKYIQSKKLNQQQKTADYNAIMAKFEHRMKYVLKFKEDSQLSISQPTSLAELIEVKMILNFFEALSLEPTIFTNFGWFIEIILNNQMENNFGFLQIRNDIVYSINSIQENHMNNISLDQKLQNQQFWLNKKCEINENQQFLSLLSFRILNEILQIVQKLYNIKQLKFERENISYSAKDFEMENNIFEKVKSLVQKNSDSYKFLMEQWDALRNSELFNLQTFGLDHLD